LPNSPQAKGAGNAATIDTLPLMDDFDEGAIYLRFVAEKRQATLAGRLSYTVLNTGVGSATTRPAGILQPSLRLADRHWRKAIGSDGYDRALGPA
jgi:hypothetical protein